VDKTAKVDKEKMKNQPRSYVTRAISVWQLANVQKNARLAKTFHTEIVLWVRHA
jgi:hypothetical protein